MNKEEIKSKNWTKRWAGSYTFISCSNYGWQYYHSLKKVFNSFFATTLHIHKNGTVSCYIPQVELIKVGNEVNDKLKNDPELTKAYLENVKNITDRILPLMNTSSGLVLSWDDYKNFLDLYDEYLPYHVFMKELIDYLPAKTIENYLDDFTIARIHSEPVYSDSERYFRNLMKAIGDKENINSDYLTCLNRAELENYLKTGHLPSQKILQNRFEFSAIYYENKNESIFSGDQAREIEEAVHDKKNGSKNKIEGMTGYRGKVKGICRIIADPLKYEIFNEGDILVTGMTRPEFIPLMKKAAAFVTDAGGMLCHAAITAREMKKPCVIGTEVATRVIKDGDVIEVDASNGIVKLGL